MAEAVSADVATEATLKTSLLGVDRSAAAGDDIPIIDMAAPGLADALWEAANTVGFFTVTNHGIPQSSIDAVFGASAGYFAQERDVKEAQCPFARQLNSGYEYFSQVRPSTGTADQKESLQITAREGAMDGRWPSEPASLERDSHELMKAAHGLACRLLSLLEPKACPKLEPGTLAKAHTLWAADGQCTLRLLHYPAVPEDAAPGLWRAGPHTDWCCVTLLFQRPDSTGLECAANPRAVADGSGAWARVEPFEGGIAVNIGDMLSRWSSGKLLSNLHRVRMPTDPAERNRSRYSVAFFAQADQRQLIESEESEPITAGDYILGRIKSNFAK